ncbi:histidine kinase [bacterium endosymbiont of Escarpia laminata]|nr:MAG: histidine kinase [bacterium endosymbiont of Escarpia laminata]
MNNIQLVLRIAIIVFIVEGIIMLGLSVLGPIPFPGLEAIIDAFVLVLIVSPIMSFWVIKPYIKARDHAEQDLTRIARHNALLLNTAGEGIFGVDSQGRTTFINSTAARMVGHKPEELIGRVQHEIFHHTRQDGSPYPVEECPICSTYRDGKVHSIDSEFFWRKDGTGFPVELVSTPIREEDKTVGAVVTFRDITERKQLEKDLRKSRNTYRTLVDNLPQRIFYKDTNSVYISCNRQYAADLGITPAALVGRSDYDFHPVELAEQYRTDDKSVMESGKVKELDERYIKDGEERYIHTVKTPLKNEQGKSTGILVIFWDITEQKAAEQERQMMEVQLRHAQKLEAVGQLAAGIAHEINTPTQFINDNTCFLQQSFADYGRLFAAYERLTDAAASGTVPKRQVNEVRTLAEEIDIDYLQEEVPQAVEQSLEGLERITRIVRAMKEFSHPGTEEKTPTDLNRAIETTIDVSRSEWKYSAELITELDPALPQVPVLVGEFNQVMLNLIVNAAHAIGDVVGESGEMGEIRITTRRDGEWAEITICDTGKGVPKAIQKRIFDPFFTTKEVGKGTGQGLSVAWSVIVDKHGGAIDVESEEGKGTTFIIRLPVKPEGKLHHE